MSALRRRRGIRAYFVCLGLLFVLVASVAAWSSRSASQRSATDAAQKGADIAARQAAASMSLSMAEATTQLVKTAQSPGIAAAFARPEGCTLSFAGIGPFSSGHLDLVRPDGRVHCSSLGTLPAPVSYHDASWAGNDAAPTVSGPIVDRVTGKDVLVLAVPAPDGMGSIVCFLDLDSLAPGLALQFAGADALEIVVTSADGRTILSRSIDPTRWTMVDAGTTTFQAGVAPDGTTSPRRDVDGVERIYGRAVGTVQGWNVFAGADRARVIERFGAPFHRSLLAIGCGLAALLALTLLTYRRVAGPMVRLARAVRANVEAAPNERTPIDVSGPTEVRAVVDEFNHLLDEVQCELVERRRAEEAAEASARTYRLLFEHNPQPMAIWDIETHRYLAVNDAMVAHYGYSHDEFLTLRVLDIVEPAPDLSHEQLQRRLADHSTVETVHRSGPWRHITKDGTTISVEVNSHTFDFHGRAARFVQITDITQRLENERHLQHLAVYDDLTGLPNRTLLLDRLGLALVHAQRSNTTLGLLFVDLDRFKLVNNAHGRDTGDELLRSVGERLRTSLRAGDTVARVSGNEFAVLCPQLIDETEAISVTGRIEGMLAAPFELSTGSVFVTASVGIALSNGNDRAEDLLRNADAAVHRAKERGGSRYEIFDETIRHRTLVRLETSIELRRALEDDQFRVHYQPSFDLMNGACVGAEALIRWEHPTRGLLAPADFIGIAEETGLIAPIGNWILRTACRQAAAWRAEGMGPLSMSVNLSARELTQPDLVSQVGEALDQAGLAAEALCLEITETSLVDDPDASISVLASLRELGVRLSIDDFGTGYSSLLYLRRYDADYLKIDRSFVAGLGMNPQDDAIVTTTIDLAHVFGMAVVAEGVETQQQAHGLRVRGCDFAQGYLWSRPVPPDQFPRLPMRDGATGSSAGTGDQRS